MAKMNNQNNESTIIPNSIKRTRRCKNGRISIHPKIIQFVIDRKMPRQKLFPPFPSTRVQFKIDFRNHRRVLNTAPPSSPHRHQHYAARSLSRRHTLTIMYTPKNSISSISKRRAFKNVNFFFISHPFLFPPRFLTTDKVCCKVVSRQNKQKKIRNYLFFTSFTSIKHRFKFIPPATEPCTTSTRVTCRHTSARTIAAHAAITGSAANFLTKRCGFRHSPLSRSQPNCGNYLPFFLNFTRKSFSKHSSSLHSYHSDT